MRKIILIIVSILMVLLSLQIASSLAGGKDNGKKPLAKIVKTVYTNTVSNRSVPVIINSSGSLTAYHKIDLYAEVQGVLAFTETPFKPGTHYAKGQDIINLDSRQFYAGLQAEKSKFFSAITAVMPDIQMDYPNEYRKWQDYLSSIDMEKPLPELPKPASEKERFFMSGRAIYTQYYLVQNQELKFNKYRLQAPFSGVLTEAFVSQGTLVRAGQKLGTFIDPSQYEMAVHIQGTYAGLLQKGSTVHVYNADKSRSWQAEVARINAKVDQNTQTIGVYLQIEGEGLREGMYLEAALQTGTIEEALEIPRKLLVDDSAVFVVDKDRLQLQTIDPVYFNEETVIIKGLKEGTSLLSRVLPGAYNGMLVKTIQEPVN